MLTGTGTGTGTATAAATTAVAGEVAGLLSPAALIAVSCTTIVSPTSAAASVYVCPVAPEIGAHAPPAGAQSSHCQTYDVGLFVQDPRDSVNVWPSTTLPEIDGDEVLTGTAPATTPVAAEFAGLLSPVPLTAVSCTTIVCPTSVAPSVYVCPIAPEIGAHTPPEGAQSSHCQTYDVGLFVQDPC
ncbi:MAG: hypothetical protein ACLP8S_02165, partial [Solirubrobacteraceae bacterium]